MPISGVLLSCKREQVHQIEEQIHLRTHSEVRSIEGGTMVVVTDTESIEQDRREVEALSALPGVLLGHVVFSNVEDIAERTGTATAKSGVPGEVRQ